MPNNISQSQRLASSTVRIECALRDRSVSTGTGFFCSLLHRDGYYAPVIVTSRHVVAGAERGRLHLHLADRTGQLLAAKYHTITLDDFQARWLPHPEPAVDLCVMPIAALLGEVQRQASLALQMLDIDLIPTPAELTELAAIEDVVVVGYPNGIWDSVHNRPIVRKGITATEPDLDYMGRPQFLIDTAWLPGTSGSPVFLWNIGSYVTKAGELIGRSRVRLLGILCTSPTRQITRGVTLIDRPAEEPASVFPTIPSNLGVVVKARKLLEFEPILEAIAAGGQKRWAW